LSSASANLYVNLNDIHPIKQRHEAHSSIIGAALPVLVDAEIPDSLFEIETEDEDEETHATLAEGSPAKYHKRLSRDQVTLAESPVAKHHKKFPLDQAALAKSPVARHRERLPWDQVTLAKSPVAKHHKRLPRDQVTLAEYHDFFKHHERLSWDHAMRYGVDANHSTAFRPRIQITQDGDIEDQMDAKWPHEATHSLQPSIQGSASQSFGSFTDPLARYFSLSDKSTRLGAKISLFQYREDGGVSRVGFNTLLEPGMKELDSGQMSAIPGPVGRREPLGSCHAEVVAHHMDGNLAASLMFANPTHDKYLSALEDPNESPLFDNSFFPPPATSPNSRQTSPSTDHGHTAKRSKASTSPETSTSISSKNSIHCSFPGCSKPLFDRSTKLRHERDVHGLHGGDDFEWRCPVCMRSFKRKDNCLKHLRKYHTGAAERVLPLKVWKP
jgi:hypothetical protein